MSVIIHRDQLHEVETQSTNLRDEGYILHHQIIQLLANK